MTLAMKSNCYTGDANTQTTQILNCRFLSSEKKDMGGVLRGRLYVIHSHAMHSLERRPPGLVARLAAFCAAANANVTLRTLTRPTLERAEPPFYARVRVHSSPSF